MVASANGAQMATDVHDAQWAKVTYRACEIEHRYGENVHILHDPSR